MQMLYDKTGFATFRAATPEITALVQGFDAVETFQSAHVFPRAGLESAAHAPGGQPRHPVFPKLYRGQVAITWIGHASFLIQFTDLNVLIDPNFANWLFLLKRIKRSGLKIQDLPRIDLVLLTHAHFDHFTNRRCAGCRSRKSA